LGNIRVLAYFKGEPLLVLGPDFVYVLIEMALVNFFVGTFLGCMDASKHPQVHTVGCIIIALQNLIYLLTVLWNPGLPTRNPKKYNKSFLNKVVILKQHLFCPTCRVIKVSNKET
jgi:hypothetical protein